MKKIFYAIAYWIGQLTWGILMTFIGALVTLFCLIFFKGKIHKNGYGFITEVFGNWGGLELGAFALCGNYSKTDTIWYEHTRKHEFGHSLQNLIFGPLFPFIVAIPSACRYWYDVYMAKKGIYLDEEWYDSIWFEGTATKWGTKAVDWIEDNK